MFLVLILVGVAGLGWFGVQLQTSQPPISEDATLVSLATGLSYTSTPSATATVMVPIDTSTAMPTRSADFGTLFFTARLGARSHIWAYVPGDQAPSQITVGPWDDKDPAVSPDGAKLAFASHRDGNWELYLLDLENIELRRLTETPEYEGHPTWSPDGLWLAYEAYSDGDLDIWIMPIDVGQAPIQLTTHPEADYSPTWDPEGRRITFVSHRDGSPQIFVADLDQPGDRFRKLKISNGYTSDPVFDPNGGRLAYTVHNSGLNHVYVYQFEESKVGVLGQGRSPAWSPDGTQILAIMDLPSNSHLQVYSVEGSGILPFGVPIQGKLEWLSWSRGGLSTELTQLSASMPTPTELYDRRVGSSSSVDGRFELAQLPDIEAPYAALSDAVDEAFNALRARIVEEAGWDFLQSLENAFVGVNDPLPPGLKFNDWLYTGRAFAFNTSALQAGWVEVGREDRGGETYWRVFLRAARQDGSMGEPLTAPLWDFSTRNSGDPEAYDQGGSWKEQIPSGYYIDFTRLADDYGFERLTALSNWRTFYPAARFNEFAMTEGLNWEEAMLELYPLSAIITPTPYRTPTNTPTRTPRPSPTPWWWYWRSPTPSRTSTPFVTPTP
jgi:TolB protein